jgi:uncharacterized protein YxeA
MIKTIAIIIVSVSIFGLLIFVFVRNQIQKRLNYYVKQKKKKNHTNFKKFS